MQGTYQQYNAQFYKVSEVFFTPDSYQRAIIRLDSMPDKLFQR